MGGIGEEGVRGGVGGWRGKFVEEVFEFLNSGGEGAEVPEKER